MPIVSDPDNVLLSAHHRRSPVKNLSKTSAIKRKTPLILQTQH